MSPCSRDSFGMIVGAFGVLLLGSGVFLAMGLTLENPLCLAAGWLCGGAALATAAGGWLAPHRFRPHRAG